MCGWLLVTWAAEVQRVRSCMGSLEHSDIGNRNGLRNYCGPGRKECILVHTHILWDIAVPTYIISSAYEPSTNVVGEMREN